MANRHAGDVAPMTKAENSAMVTMALKVFSYTPIDLRDPEQVRNRIVDYFSECERLGLRPGNMGMYSALGLSRQEVHNIISGRDRKKVSPESCDTIKKSLQVMATYRELLGVSGKINPVTLIFWQKNFDGLKDNSSIELEVAQPAQYTATMSPEEIAARIEQDIPIDYDAEIID